MAYEKRDMSGSLFKNKEKEEGTQQPDATGWIKIDGVEMRLAAWTHRPEGKDPYQSIKVSSFDQSGNLNKKEQAQAPHPDPSEYAVDDIPW